MLTIVICLVVIGMACVAVLRITLEDEKQPATTPRQRHRAAPAEGGPASARQVLFDVTDLDDPSPRTNGSLPAPAVAAEDVGAPTQEPAGETDEQDLGGAAEPTTLLIPEPTAELPEPAPPTTTDLPMSELPTAEVPVVAVPVADEATASEVEAPAPVPDAPVAPADAATDTPSPTVALQPEAPLTVAIPVAEPAEPAVLSPDRPVAPPDPRTPFGGMALPDVDTPMGAAIGWPDDLDDEVPERDGPPPPDPSESAVPLAATTLIEPPPDTGRFEPPATDQVPAVFRQHPTPRAQAPRPVGGATVATAPRPSSTMFDEDDRGPVVLTTVAPTQRLRSTMALVITLTLVGALVAVILMAALAAMYLGARSAIVG